MNITFRHAPAEDESVDPATQILVDGVECDYEIQHTEWAGSDHRRVVNRYFRDEKGGIVGVQMISEHNTEAQARKAVTALLRAK